MNREIMEERPTIMVGERVEVSYHEDFINSKETIYLWHFPNAMCEHAVVQSTDVELYKAGKTYHVALVPFVRHAKPDLKVDDPVIVWDGVLKHRRHFAEWGKDGSIGTFMNGATSWTNNNCRHEYWDHYEIQFWWRVSDGDDMEGV